MFFNTLVKVADDKEMLNVKLKAAIILPGNITDAQKQIDTFCDYVVGLSSTAADKRSVPNVSSVPFFLTYFWQIQDYEKLPIFFHSTHTVFKLPRVHGRAADELGEKYVAFYELTEELRKLFMIINREIFHSGI